MSESLPPRRLPSLLLFALAPLPAWFVLRPLVEPVPPLPALYVSVGFSIFALLATIYLVPALGPTFVKANLKGRDLLKVNSTPIPESMGLVCASVYILLLILFIPFAFSPVSLSTSESQYTVREGIVINAFPHYQLSVYLSSLLSLLIATMLGFLDDVFDIRWRHKIPIPIIASIPLLMVYYADNGNTHIVVPIPFRPFFGSLLNLGTPSLIFRTCYHWMRIIGPLYYLYMSLLSTFSTNSINILAGINGSEVSQAVVIALSVILNDLLYLPWPTGFRVPLHLLGSRAEVEVGGVWSAGMAYGSTQLVERHLFSLYFMLPLVGVCLGFLFHNWYPSRAFPGDTLCYVTGMAFAVVGIQAHFSKTLLLFFLPQIFNFILSCPQLFGLVPCPRHRVPRFDQETHLLYPSKTQFLKRTSRLSSVVLRVLAGLGCTELTTLPDGKILEATNLTLLNVLLLRLGPMREKRLTQALIAVQIAGSAVAFIVRYGLAYIVYDGDRR